MNYRNDLAIRWSVYSAAATTAILLLVQWVHGYVPDINTLKLVSNWVIKLPFEVSGWWYVCMGPIYSFVLSRFFQSQLVRGNSTYGTLRRGLMIKGMIFFFLLTLLIGIYAGLLPSIVIFVTGVALGRPRLSTNMISNRLSLTLSFGFVLGSLLGAGLAFGPLFVLFLLWLYANFIFNEKVREWKEYIFNHI